MQRWFNQLTKPKMKETKASQQALVLSKSLNEAIATDDKWNLEQIKQLVEKKADVNYINEYKQTILESYIFWMISQKPEQRAEILTYLLEQKADPNLSGSPLHHHPLHSIIIMQPSEVALEPMKILIEYKSDVNHKLYAYKTPLLAASQQKKYPALELLLKSGANPALKIDDLECPSFSLMRQLGNYYGEACRSKRTDVGISAETTLAAWVYQAQQTFLNSSYNSSESPFMALTIFNQHKWYAELSKTIQSYLSFPWDILKNILLPYLKSDVNLDFDHYKELAKQTKIEIEKEVSQQNTEFMMPYIYLKNWYAEISLPIIFNLRNILPELIITDTLLPYLNPDLLEAVELARAEKEAEEKQNPAALKPKRR